MPDQASGNILSESIIKTLLYSDIFHYPLTSEEIFQRLGTNHVSQKDVDVQLDRLSQQGVVHRSAHFFSIRADNDLFDNRISGNALAEKMLPKAMRQARLIYHFPFVRAVMLSGSLSKNYADSNSDVDFFIVTRPGRLWIARTLLALYQKTILLNSRKYFCLNYFVDELHTEIEERNLFTAIELATLIPVHGFGHYQQLYAVNCWLQEFLPNFRPRQHPTLQDTPAPLKGWIEKILSLSLFNRLEHFSMRLTSAHWARLHAKRYDRHHFEIAFKARAYVSKSHPDFYQKRVTEAYAKKVADYFRDHPTAAA